MLVSSVDQEFQPGTVNKTCLPFHDIWGLRWEDSTAGIDSRVVEGKKCWNHLEIYSLICLADDAACQTLAGAEHLHMASCVTWLFSQHASMGTYMVAQGSRSCNPSYTTFLA